MTTQLSHAVIREVGLRDGLQSIKTILPTERKMEWIRDAHAAGQREIEVGSFVPPRLLPQLADTAELLAYAKTLPGLFASVLVPNLKGAERALDGDADLMLLPLSASHEHSLANLRKTPELVAGDLQSLLEQAADRSRVGVAHRVGQADAVGTCVEQGLHQAQHFGGFHLTLDRAAEGRADAAFDQRLLARGIAGGADAAQFGHHLVG